MITSIQAVLLLLCCVSAATAWEGEGRDSVPSEAELIGVMNNVGLTVSESIATGTALSATENIEGRVKQRAEEILNEMLKREDEKMEQQEQRKKEEYCKIDGFYCPMRSMNVKSCCEDCPSHPLANMGECSCEETTTPWLSLTSEKQGPEFDTFSLAFQLVYEFEELPHCGATILVPVNAGWEETVPTGSGDDLWENYGVLRNLVDVHIIPGFIHNPKDLLKLNKEERMTAGPYSQPLKFLKNADGEILVGGPFYDLTTGWNVAKVLTSGAIHTELGTIIPITKALSPGTCTSDSSAHRGLQQRECAPLQLCSEQCDCPKNHVCTAHTRDTTEENCVPGVGNPCLKSCKPMESALLDCNNQAWYEPGRQCHTPASYLYEGKIPDSLSRDDSPVPEQYYAWSLKTSYEWNKIQGSIVDVEVFFVGLTPEEEEPPCACNGGLVLTSDGKVHMWGGFSPDDEGEPLRQLNFEKKVVDFAVGACSAIFLLEDGSIRTLGDNMYGTLGDRTYDSAWVEPVQPVGVDHLTFTRVALKKYTAAAVTTDGHLYRWGQTVCSIFEQWVESDWVANTPVPSRFSTPDDQRVLNVFLNPGLTPNPVWIEGSPEKKEWAGGAIIVEDGTLYLWGSAEHAYQDQCVFQPADLGPVATVAMGGPRTSLAALTVDGRVFQYGYTRTQANPDYPTENNDDGFIMGWTLVEFSTTVVDLVPPGPQTIGFTAKLADGSLVSFGMGVGIGSKQGQGINNQPAELGEGWTAPQYQVRIPEALPFNHITGVPAFISAADNHAFYALAIGGCPVRKDEDACNNNDPEKFGYTCQWNEEQKICERGSAMKGVDVVIPDCGPRPLYFANGRAVQNYVPTYPEYTTITVYCDTQHCRDRDAIEMPERCGGWEVLFISDGPFQRDGESIIGKGMQGAAVCSVVPPNTPTRIQVSAMDLHSTNLICANDISMGDKPTSAPWWPDGWDQVHPLTWRLEAGAVEPWPPQQQITHG